MAAAHGVHETGALEREATNGVDVAGHGHHPCPAPSAPGPSNHLRIGGQSVLVDTGNGCVRRMVEMGEDTTNLDYIFITHMHSDHTIDLAHVLITGWIRYRKTPFTIIGPARTRDFVDRLIHAYEEDIRIRRLRDRVGEDVMDVRVIGSRRWRPL